MRLTIRPTGGGVPARSGLSQNRPRQNYSLTPCSKRQPGESRARTHSLRMPIPLVQAAIGVSGGNRR